MNVVKRDCELQEFDKHKIYNAIYKAMKSSGSVKPKIAEDIADEIELLAQEAKGELSVSDIEALVFDKLISKKQRLTARAYEGYRAVREFQREENSIDEQLSELLEGISEYWNSENSNKNSSLVTTQRDYMAGIVSTDITRRFLLPPDIVQAHDAGIIHFHDADYFGQMALHNCELINLEDMLQNGTVMNKVMIETPHRFLTAMTIATQIITAVTSSSYGGATISLTHLAPFVRKSYNEYYRKYINRGLDDVKAGEWAWQDTMLEIRDGVQTFNYQINSMANTNGQAPFLSVFMYLGETDEYKHELALIIKEFFKQRIEGFKNEVGVHYTNAFPKLLYVLEEDNAHENSKYWELTKLAAECTAKRMVPDYISEKIMKQNKIDDEGNGHCYPCMGCRSFLTPYTDKNKKPKYYGRFNQGVVTINLADVALSSERNVDDFWELLDERLELCHRALQIRHERLSNVKAKNAPILWVYGALARLDKDDSIHSLLHGNYSTLSLGYAALYECVKYMTGESHTSEVGKEFGIKVMQKLNDKCAEWKEAEDIAYSVYGTPIESTVYKFAKCLKDRFGVVEGITDRNFITNSYHVFVEEPISPFDKLAIEAEFQKLSPGGCVSYVECANLSQNLDATLEVIKFIYDHIMYAELNMKSDYCQKCAYDGEIKIFDKGDGTLDWKCPQCGNTDHDTLNVARRVCGYISTNFFNQGRTDEIRNRYIHLDNHETEVSL